MDRDEAIELVKGPFSDAVRNVMEGYVAPFLIATQMSEGSWTFNNGTCFFLDCGKGPFLVTANHVYESYLSIKQKFPRTICQVLNLNFHPEDRLIDSNTSIDIATFEFHRSR